nr:titin-like isoform X1 [Pocillopora verrucosa]
MNFFVCSQIKAIGLFVTLFAYATSQDTGTFSTKPKDKEVFVGEDVQFDWEYVKEDVQEIQFGVVTIKNKNVAILVKTDNGTKQNNLHKDVEWVRDRVEIVPGKRASFKIRNLEMEDSRTFFCQIRYGIHGKTESDEVKLSVVDLLIDKSASDVSKESWLNHKISVVCAVKILEGDTAMFSWMHIPSNTTVPKGWHDDTASKSYLQIVTKKDVEFETLQCQAENKHTVKYHAVNVKKLTPPSPPRNLKTQTVFDEAAISIQLKWDPPSTDGGTEIKHYVIQYVAKGLSWKSPNKAETTSTEYGGLRLPNGKYNARVRAQNKAGLGPPSNEVIIDLEDFEHSQLPISGGSPMHFPQIVLLMLSVLAWFCMVASN